MIKVFWGKPRLKRLRYALPTRAGYAEPSCQCVTSTRRRQHERGTCVAIAAADDAVLVESAVVQEPKPDARGAVT